MRLRTRGRTALAGGVAAGILMLSAAPASATYSHICTGYAGCSSAGYSNAGYASASSTSYWGMYPGHNCTNYAAYRLIKRGINASYLTGKGNAYQWGSVARANGVAVDMTPRVGDIAWWNGSAGFGTSGHVGYVEQVGNGSFVMSDDNYGGDFHWTRVTTSASPGSSSLWPTGFIHFGGSAASAGYEEAFQANTGKLFSYADTGAANLDQGMMPGTSPSIARLAGGGYEMAFQANTGQLFVYGDAGGGNTSQGMMSGTSPSIAASPGGGFQVAFQANTGNLYRYSSTSGSANLGQGMLNGTSPSIAALASGGYEMAFQANTGQLFVYGDAGGGNTSQGMMSGTSPSIAASPGGGFQVAFQANTGNLYRYSSTSGSANLGQGMLKGTSPGIA